MQTQYGAHVLDGGTRFTLWAPGAQSVSVQLDDKTLLMSSDNGLHEVFVPDVADGALYKFEIDGKFTAQDPASAFQPEDVDGPSEVVDFRKFAASPPFKTLPWAESIIYELHVGTFSPEGTFAGVEKKLDHLASLGITAIELMPLNDVPGKRSWGYDGVLLNAPNAAYGRPEDLKHLIDAAHARGLMVYVDVVYNHFGPAANYIERYAAPFFHEETNTWGPEINLEERHVRDFIISNAMQWLGAYGVDGLRLDAVHALRDSSDEHFLYEFARKVRDAFPDCHLIFENDFHEARYLQRNADGNPITANAQWSDDFHNNLHILLTGEQGKRGGYKDFADNPLRHLARAMAEHFSYPGEYFPPMKKVWGDPTTGLPPEGTIFFEQNHDKSGNRDDGARWAALLTDEQLRMTRALLLLNPHIPMLFMGEEAKVKSPFLYFCSWEGELAEKTREGRKQEFGKNPNTVTAMPVEDVPDPMDVEAFRLSCLDWNEIESPDNDAFLAMTKELIRLRKEKIIPMIKEGFTACTTEILKSPDGQAETGMMLTWTTQKGRKLQIAMNFGADAIDLPAIATDPIVWNTHPERRTGKLQHYQLIVAAS